jgi:hypothetical protein
VYRHAVNKLVTPDLETPLPTEKQLTNPWDMAKEGRAKYDPALPHKGLRK